jgi:putative flippase GtrA
MLREKLGRLLRSYLTVRFLKDKLAGAGTSLANVGVLVLLVEVFEGDPLITNIGRAVVTSQASFLIARQITWRDRRRRSVFGHWRRYMAVKSLTLVLKQAVFIGMVLVGLPYVVVYFCSTTLVGLMGFQAADKYIFDEA